MDADTNGGGAPLLDSASNGSNDQGGTPAATPPSGNEVDTGGSDADATGVTTTAATADGAGAANASTAPATSAPPPPPAAEKPAGRKSGGKKGGGKAKADEPGEPEATVHLVLQTSKVSGPDERAIPRGRVVTAPKSRADKMIGTGSARLATDDDIAVARRPFVALS